MVADIKGTYSGALHIPILCRHVGVGGPSFIGSSPQTKQAQGVVCRYRRRGDFFLSAIVVWLGWLVKCCRESSGSCEPPHQPVSNGSMFFATFAR